MQNLTPFSISAPGFGGVNLSDSPVDLAPSYALEAYNCVIDKSGRVASRKGWSASHAANTELSTGYIECIGEVIENGGTATTVCAGNNYLYKLSGSTLTTLTYGGGGVAPTITTSNWWFCQMAGVGMFWQRGYDPLIYDPAVSTTTFRRLNERSGSAGTVQQANVAIAAYGRVWCADLTADKNTIYFSDLLTPHIYTGGSSGSLNLIGVWPEGGDEIVGLAAHNNFLFVFGRKQILIYQGASTPSTMSLQDTVVGIGCIARDTIQTIGDDVIFLSDSGVRSLARTVQEKSAPMKNISRNVHDNLQSEVSVETLANIKSGYSVVNQFYLLTLPSAQKTYCFDLRTPLQDGSSRVTTWNLVPKAFYETKGRKFYLGMAGYVGEHTSYLDDASVYRMKYYTTWIDFGNPVQTSILKKVLLTLISAGNQSLVFYWAYDFSATYSTYAITTTNAGASADYGVAEYGIAEYGGTAYLHKLSAPGSGSGAVLQFGFECNVNGNQVAIQKIDLFTKEGRL